MWSGASVVGERPESVELTALLTIKRQLNTSFHRPPSSTALDKKADTAPLPESTTRILKDPRDCSARVLRALLFCHPSLPLLKGAARFAFQPSGRGLGLATAQFQKLKQEARVAAT